MAAQYEVAARLAEGREAVSHSQTYVSACSRLGFRHPDLTGYDGQLADHYDGETGMDLRALDADCGALGALAQAAEDALARQCGQLVDLAAAWRGPGGEAAAEFLRRHCESGAQLSARLRSAAAGCVRLRDELWRLVDAKVATVQTVDERVGAQRPVWLSAARAVSSGAGDQHAAEMIEQRVMPYVVSDIGGEWVSAVRATRDGVESAYRAATAAVDPGPGAVFAIPGELGPVVQVDEQMAPVAPVAPAAVDVPFGVPEPAGEWAASPPAPAAPGSAPPAPVSDPATPSDPPADLGVPSGLGLPGDLGLPSSGLPGSGLGGLGGLGGLIPRLANAFGDPGSGEPLGDPFDEDAWDDDHPDDGEDSEEPEDEPEPEAEAAEDTEEPPQAELADETGAAAEPEPSAPDAEPEVESAAEVSDPEKDSAPPTPGVVPKTPCEIAAEELPQVGQ